MRLLFVILLVFIVTFFRLLADESVRTGIETKTPESQRSFTEQRHEGLDLIYSRFKRQLRRAREDGGIDVVHTDKGKQVTLFLMWRHALEQALDAPIKKDMNTPSPELLTEIRDAIAASEKEIPTPDGVVFGIHPIPDPSHVARSQSISDPKEYKEMQVAQEVEQKKHAEKVLAIALRPAEASARAGGAPLILRLGSIAEKPLYINRSAIGAGLALKVTDARGGEVLLNPKGQMLRKPVPMPFGLRATPVMLRYFPEFPLDLADYCALQPDESYTVEAEWTLEIHDAVKHVEDLEERWVHTITLKAPPIQVKMSQRP